MTIIFEKITSWNDFDFDTLYDASQTHVEANFFAVADVNISAEDKKIYYKKLLQDGFDGTYFLKRENEELFLFKGTFDGTVMEFGGGYIEDDKQTLRFQWYLTAPDSMGSRNVLHLDSTADIRRVFYHSYGITKYKMATYKESDLYKWMRARISAGKQRLIEERVILVTGAFTEVELYFEI